MVVGSITSQRRLTVVSSKNGSMTAVPGSGIRIMSDSLMPFHPAIEEPSNILPSRNRSSSTSRAGIVTCCSLPRVSVKRRSANFTCFSFMSFSTSLGVMSPPGKGRDRRHSQVPCAAKAAKWSDVAGPVPGLTARRIKPLGSNGRSFAPSGCIRQGLLHCLCAKSQAARRLGPVQPRPARAFGAPAVGARGPVGLSRAPCGTDPGGLQSAVYSRALWGRKNLMKLGRAPRTFQELIFALQSYWSGAGCIVLEPYDMEVGAGTFHSATFLAAVGPEPWRAAYVQPSRRPADGRYGDNPFRLQHYYQFQVTLKPSPLPILELYLGSLAALGLDPLVHDVRFVEDNWESPTLGAWGLGWEVWLNGMEVT